ncbi:MAG: hypothetical protein P1U81_00040 [Verrucomicrobiales bacterium]|nr:hypothetical protein [Verrucomicrobiales bacterium]
MLVRSEIPPGTEAPLSHEVTGRRFRKLTAFPGRQFDRIVGFASMTGCLAVVSAIPVFNLLSLGFLLEASSRVAASGKLRDGFIGLDHFARLGKILLGFWFWFLPVRLVHSFWRDAELIQPGSEEANGLRIFLAFLIVVITLHLLAAILRGGKLRYFLIPAPFQWIRWLSGRQSFPWPKGTLLLLPRIAKRLFQLGKLGFFGFLGAAVWLAIPLGIPFLSSGATEQRIAVLGSFLGALILGGTVLLLPFLQTRYAMTRRFRDFFAISEARALFKRAPLAFWLALSVTLLFALPLYLLKIELTPNEVAWLPNIIFVLFIFPARLLLGWALSRAEKAETARRWLPRWIAGIAAVPVVAAYVFFVWLSQYVSWHGTYSLLEQHAFLVPAPLFGL